MKSTIDFVEKRRRGFGSRIHMRQVLLERTVVPYFRHYKLKGHRGCVNCARFNESGNKIASGSDDTKVLIYERRNHKYQCVRRIDTGHSANIFSVDFLLNEEEVVTGAMDGRVMINHCSDSEGRRRQLYQYTGSCFKVETQRDNKNTVVSSGFGGVYVHDIRSPHTMNVVKTTGDQDEMWGEPYGLKLNPAMPYLFTIAGGFPYVLTFDIRRPPPSHRVTSLTDAVHVIGLGPRSAATCVRFQTLTISYYKHVTSRTHRLIYPKTETKYCAPEAAMVAKLKI